MTTKKIERFECDVSGCKEISHDGAKGWITLRLRTEQRDGGPLSEEKHVCPEHDQTPIGQVLVELRLDTHRMLGQLTSKP